MATSWSLTEYSSRALREELCRAGVTDLRTVGRKLHCRYFDEYFDHLGTKTILVEHEYVDRDYLEDFAAYYVTCFRSYQRFCRRLHFTAQECDSNIPFRHRSRSPARRRQTGYWAVVLFHHRG